MYINTVAAIAIIGIFGVICEGGVEDYYRSKVQATININNSESASPVNIKKTSCDKHNYPRRHGGEVCGTDGQTYPNSLYLKCINAAQRSSKRIQIRYKGPCRKSISKFPPECERDMLYRPVCGSDNNTYANVGALDCKNTINPGYNVRVAREGECSTEGCPCRGDLEKVCASNGVTYRNVGEVRCLKKYHNDLHVLHAGGCNIREVRRALGRRRSCNMAMNRFEWNPVCGENNLTYANPYLYICHHPKTERKCAAKPGECGTLSQLACLHMEKINHKLMKATSLVCGSNGVTFRSYEHLHCATVYDKYLTAVSVGRCSRNYDPCSLLKGPLIDSGQPVCGTDGFTYTNIEALWCVRHLEKKDLKYRHDGQCL